MYLVYGFMRLNKLKYLILNLKKNNLGKGLDYVKHLFYNLRYLKNLKNLELDLSNNNLGKDFKEG